MEAFYNKNYKNYEVFTAENFFQQRIWNLHYDSQYDLAYVFLATIKQIKGEKLASFTPH